ncbi:hypothetical protein [Novisyntrophococcus fermenticellae]|uniref:hypothetical protein n=1 Tax=Novisyntrophococcus fermenticellae TaxID=2068655 RepID=UPI001E63B1F8|nr:hypothetical protein [Novisyntrophococcus fermenticellae]
MAKFLRFIVNLCVVCFLLTGLALIVPQFAGISTAIVGDSITDTNLSNGSVVYGRTVSLDKLEAGDKLLRTTNTSVYAAEIIEIDSDTGHYTVKGKGGTTEEVTLRGTGEKVLITIPFIGYVSIAMQTFEGRIILGLAVAFLVILFILSEIWKNDDEEDMDKEDEQIGETEEKNGELIAEEEEEPEAKLSRRERKARKKKEKRRGKPKKEEPAKEKDIVEEMSYMQDTSSAEQAKSGIQEIQSSETHGNAAEDIEAETRELILEPADEVEEINIEEAVKKISEPDSEQVIRQDNTEDLTAAIQAALEYEMDKDFEKSKGEDIMQHNSELKNEQIPAESRKLAMPALTVDEILEKAHAGGDDPEVIEVEEDGLSLVDYSEIL